MDITVLLIYLIPLLLFLILAWNIAPKGIKATAKLSTLFGFLHGFIVWAIFCWSEWREAYGAVEFFKIFLFSSLVGLIGMVMYFLVGMTVFSIRRRF